MNIKTKENFAQTLLSWAIDTKKHFLIHKFIETKKI